MEVIFYQLFIIATIVVTHYLKRKWVIWICLAWTLETLALLFYAPLIIIQLGVIWVTWFLLNNNLKKKVQIDELESYIAAKPIDIQSIVRTTLEDRKEVLKGNDHRAFLLETIKGAKEQLVILSGWVTDHVVDEDFLKLLKAALDSGVKVGIGYGWQDSSGKHQKFESSKRAIANLESLRKEYPKTLLLKEYASHEKILIKDADYVVYGSNNWLSNKKFRNTERSIVIRNSELARAESKEIFEFIE